MKNHAALTFLALLSLLSSHPASAHCRPALGAPPPRPAIAAAVTPAGEQDVEQLKEQAERLYAEGSYAQSLAIYEQLAGMELPEDEQRWVQFRIGDTMWRSQNATQTHDDTGFQRARERLLAVLETYETPASHDDLWAGVHRSLGDFWWARHSVRNWSDAWQHYQQALEYWAHQRDIDHARRHYLDIVFAAAEPEWAFHDSWYRQSIAVPSDVLENAVKIAQSPENVSHSRYLLAMSMRRNGGWRHQQRVESLFQAVIEASPSHEWYDDALFHYAEWLSQQGRVIRSRNGQWTTERDYPRALELYERLAQEFRKGGTQYWDQATQRISEITAPYLHVAVSNIFLPGSEIRFDLNWRNLEVIDLSIHRVDLTRDVIWPERSEHRQEWLDAVDFSKAEKVRSWQKPAGADGDHQPAHESVVLDEPLNPGAYLLVASGGGVSARDLLLVTDATVVMKSVADQSLIYFCDAFNGAPIPAAEVTLWEVRTSPDGRHWTSRKTHQITNDDGIATFRTGSGENWAALFAAARKGERQAFSVAQVQGASSTAEQYRIYASTDRPAYRPGDEVQWKITARLYDDSRYSTPAGEELQYEIHDPRGTRMKAGTLALNAFGGAWDSFEVTEAMPLGLYQVLFRTKENDAIGSSALFRIEEYKLPEYEVTVATPVSEDGRRRAFQLGDVVEVDIQADYYFGAPVVNADVEVIVYQRPFWHWWQPVKQYGWLYEDADPYRWNYGGGAGSQIKREQLTTDEQGRARVSFETPLNADQDFEYTVEARVVDSSRREVAASENIRVTRQKYFVYASSPHNIHEPGEKVTIEFKALDANQQPVAAEGSVEIFRDEWKEIWITPDGRALTGPELAEEKKRHRIFPPPTPPGGDGWRLKYRGYRSELLEKRAVKTGTEGEAELTFTAPRSGYYRIVWTSEKSELWPVQAQTTVWVCDEKSHLIGYHQSGVDIIVDKETFRAGETVPVMISVPTTDRYVLFTVEGNDLHSYRLVHVEGDVKLIHLEIAEEHEPNIWLSGSVVSEGQLFGDVEQVVVPPVDHFLEVEVALNADAFEPGETGTVTVRATDQEGKPVSAEVGLALVDESIFAIQQELSGDPRAFFFNDRQSHQVQTSSTVHQKTYAKLLKNEEDELVAAPLHAEDAGAPGSVDMRERATTGYPAGAIVEGLESAARGFAGGEGGMYDKFGAPAADAAFQGRRRMEQDRSDFRPPPPPPGEDEPVRVRSDFRATALWIPDLVTDEDGVAVADVRFPDSTTRWKATARAATDGSQFGIGHVSVQTRQPLIVRLQAPRFFVAGDHTMVSAVLNNNTAEAMRSKVDLELTGLQVTDAEMEGKMLDERALQQMEIPAHGSVQIDWRVTAHQAGTARVVVKARSGRHSDGMERTYLVHEHGIEKHLVKAGKAGGDDVTVVIDIPEERDPDTTRLTVQVTPSMAVTMVEALPYLIDYPYGCTEQTMSRFLPAAIVAKTLEDLGIDPAVAMARALGRDLPSDGAGLPVPVVADARSLDELDAIIQRGLARLADFQQADGGWGWWKHSGSDHYMTAYVVWGLSLSKQAGLALDEQMLARGAHYLREELVEEEFRYDNQSWMLYALASYHQAIDKLEDFSEFERTALENLWENRDNLNAFSRALFALAAHAYGDREKAQTLARNLVNGVKVDEKPDTSVIMRGEQESHPAVITTAHWGEDGIYHRWSDGGVEATAFALKALLAIDPDHELIEPVMNWLVKNRRGAQWSNTRDTAIAVLALNDYLRVSGEADPDLEFELLVNGRSIVTRKVAGAEVFAAPSRFEVDGELIRDGRNEIRIVRRGGEGPVYFSAHAQFFSREEPVEAAGNEIFVRRDYYKLVPYPTLLAGYEFDRVPMTEGGSVRSGERMEVVLTIEAKNNYEYLVFEDLKPAGLEAVQLQSGALISARQLKQAGVERRFENADQVDANLIAREGIDYTGQHAPVYQEWRDRHVALFLDRLPQGVWEVQYELRAEVPGEFHALPVLGHAMYVPEIRGNSAEILMTVYDRQ